MDRCRCDEKSKAIQNLKFYTVGTYRPDIIENFDRTGLDVAWVKNGISYSDFRFSKPKSRKILQPRDLPENAIPKSCYKIQQMWCPFMSHIEVGKPLERRETEEHKSEEKDTNNEGEKKV